MIFYQSFIEKPTDINLNKLKELNDDKNENI